MLNKKLAEYILKMAEKDQRIRKEALKNKNKNKARLKILRTDKKNFLKAKKIIEKYGWPTFDLIGKRASRAFWLVVQHADTDVNFQKECLNFLKRAVKENQAFPQNEAYLTDRVLINQGKKQKFGTQLKVKNNKLVFSPISDKKNVNKRREKYGLNSLEEYFKEINKFRGLN